MTCRLSVVCLVCIFSPALAKTYEPTERMAACVQIDLDPAHEKYEYCKEALGDAQNNMEVHRLLEKGHDPNTVLDSEGRTLLVTATFKQQKDIVAELLNFGATKGVNVNSVANSGHSALMYAAARDDADLVNMFILGGAEVNLALLAGKKIGYTPLHFAAEHGNVKVSSALINAGANPEAKDAQGQTPFMRAQGQHPTTIKELEGLFSTYMGDLDLDLD